MDSNGNHWNENGNGKGNQTRCLPRFSGGIRGSHTPAGSRGVFGGTRSCSHHHQHSVLRYPPHRLEHSRKLPVPGGNNNDNDNFGVVGVSLRFPRRRRHLHCLRALRSARCRLRRRWEALASLGQTDSPRHEPHHARGTAGHCHWGTPGGGRIPPIWTVRGRLSGERPVDDSLLVAGGDFRPPRRKRKRKRKQRGRFSTTRRKH
mmetsp:Transcript_10430/g.24809  ORF Transcript_10430/g.24809 Transcript_10430/m.24809 type:complete len:204 (+) Transcript_10430:321-932(+)